MTDLTYDLNQITARRSDVTSTAARLASSLPSPEPRLADTSPIQNYLLRLGDAFRRDEAGFSLVEMLVTIVIMSILLTVSAMMFSALFGSEIQANEFRDQDSTSKEVASFMDARLGQVGVGGIGIEGTAPGTTKSISIAGDQIVFTSGGKCYRVFYVERTEEVNVAVADDCAYIIPVRGPNEKLPDGSYKPQLGSPLWDAVLDDPSMLKGGAQVFNLATGVTEDDNASSPTEQGLFSFWDAANQPIVEPLEADSALGDRPAAETEQVAMVRLNGEVLASSNPKVPVARQLSKPMQLSRDFYLGQS